MNRMLRSKIIKIGNSRGIRIPRAILEQTGLADEVEMRIEGNKLIIRAAHHPRHDWGDRFAAMAKESDDRLLDENIHTQWDEEEWKW